MNTFDAFSPAIELLLVRADEAARTARFRAASDRDFVRLTTESKTFIEAAQIVMREQEKHRPGVAPCSWCQKEAGIAPQPGESHTVCPRHVNKVLEEAERMAV